MQSAVNNTTRQCSPMRSRLFAQVGCMQSKGHSGTSVSSLASHHPKALSRVALSGSLEQVTHANHAAAHVDINTVVRDLADY